jgi:DNA-binding CsgD family transcriptional regulator
LRSHAAAVHRKPARRRTLCEDEFRIITKLAKKWHEIEPRYEPGPFDPNRSDLYQIACVVALKETGGGEPLDGTELSKRIDSRLVREVARFRKRRHLFRDPLPYAETETENDEDYRALTGAYGNEDGAPWVPDLTARQNSVFSLKQEGLSQKEIGARLGVDQSTVSGEIQAIKDHASKTRAALILGAKWVRTARYGMVLPGTTVR